MPLSKLICALALGAAQLSLACSTFSTADTKGYVVAKSYDWDLEHGLVLVNKKNVAKKAMVLDPTQEPAQWISKFGNITFNQYGREFPLGGMNEAGLTVEIMWLESSVYPKADTRPVINELQWIQYQLDNFTSVAEVAAAANDYRVANVYAKVHYLVCDASSSCLTFEFIGGKLVTHSGATLPARALTNDTYTRSLDYAKKFVGFGGTAPLPLSKGSLDRFVRAAHFAQSKPDEGTAFDAFAFNALTNLAQGDYSKWNIVYEPRTSEIRFRTLAKRAVKSLVAKNFDYGCRSSVQMLDINTELEGSVTDKFVPYTLQANKAMIEKSLKDIAGAFPPGTADQLAAYPDRLKCQD